MPWNVMQTGDTDMLTQVSGSTGVNIVYFNKNHGAGRISTRGIGAANRSKRHQAEQCGRTKAAGNVSVEGFFVACEELLVKMLQVEAVDP